VSDDNSSTTSRVEMELELESRNQVEVRMSNQMRQVQNLTDETDDGTIENDRVEYAVLLPDSFAILDSTFDDENSILLL
jgi:hypothetical protein